MSCSTNVVTLDKHGYRTGSEQPRVHDISVLYAGVDRIPELLTVETRRKKKKKKDRVHRWARVYVEHKDDDKTPSEESVHLR
jgi:hypothetical protein